MQRFVRRYLIAGLLVWLPILVTVLVVRFILDLMDQTLLLLPASLRPEALFGVHIPGLGALLAVVLLIATGMLVSNIIGRSLVVHCGKTCSIASRSCARSTAASRASPPRSCRTQGNSFKKVLLIEYPRTGIWSVGFQTAGDVPLIERPHWRAAGVRVHSDHAQSHLRLHRAWCRARRRSSWT